MQMHKGTLALAITAALSTIAFIRSTNADATSASKPQNAAGPSHGQPHFKYPIHARPAADAVLFDQSGTAVNGAPSQNFESSLDQYDAQGADDFVVTDAAGWTVSAFNFQISPSTSPPGDPATATYDIEVFADNVGVPAATAACSYPSVSGTVDAAVTSLSVSLPSPCVLAQGTYWISMVVNLDYVVGGQLFWADNSSGSGANSKWQNPGGGFGTVCSTWSDLAGCGASSSPVGGGETAFLFQVVGSVGATSGCAGGDICLVSTVGTDTTPGACAATDMIDSTVGDQLNFCYTVTNNTSVELDYHSLANNIDGSLLSLMNHPVAAGGTYQFNHIETVGTTNSYNSTWTASDVAPAYAAVVESGGGNCLDRIFADGFDGSAPPCAGNGNFIDITQTGTALGLGDDDTFDVSLPFSFNFYGATSNVLTVSNNGGAILGAPGSFLTFFNSSLPVVSLPGPALFPLWDDFSSGSGDVYTDTRGSAPNRQFIVEWFDRVHFPGSSNVDGATFELVLNEDGTIQFEYQDVAYTAINDFNDPADCSGGLCATIGLQGSTTLFDQFSSLEASVTDNSGIKWTPNSPQIFSSTDTVTVNVGAPQIVVNPGSLTGTGLPGASGTIPFAIENHGDRDLHWGLTEAAPANLHFPPAGSRYVMPLGDPAKASNRPVPLALRHSHGAKPGQHAFHVPFSGATTFAADIYNNNFETFDALAPAATTTVAATDGTPWTGGAFIDGDFSKFYVISGNFAGNPDAFATVDTATGVVTPIGTADSGGAGWNGMAYDASTGKLYAVAGCGSSSLYTIDPNTGAATLVGSLTNETCSVAIAFDPQGNLYSFDVVSDALYAVDKTNGNDAAIGSIGFNANYAQDMAFDESTGILYLAGFDLDALTDSIYTLDLQTGTATLVGPIGPSMQEVDAIGIETVGGPCAQPQDLPWLSLSSAAGVTPPNGSTPVTATIDGTGTNDGDVRSGTVCAASNDPQQHVPLAVPIDYTFQTGAQPAPTLSKVFTPATITAGQSSTLTITLANGGTLPATLTSNLTDAFPNGMTVAATPNASTTCGGTVTATAGTDSVVLDAATALIPASGTCDIVVDVETASSGTFDNSIPAGALQTDAGSNAAPANATLTVDPPPPPSPTVDEQFNPASVLTNAPSTLTITLGNTNASPATLTAAFTDSLPTGLLVAPTPNASTTCGGGTVTAAANDTAVILDVNAVLPAAGSCTVQVDVQAAVPGTFVNTIAAGALQTDAGQNAVDSVATLTVTPQPVPPTIAKAFNPTTVAKGVPSTLTITLANTEATVASLAAPLTDAFPSGLVVAAVPNASTTCGGTVTAVASTASVTLDGVGSAIPASGSCTITVDVESATPATYQNDIPVGALQTDVGSNTTPADATLNVTP